MGRDSDLPDGEDAPSTSGERQRAAAHSRQTLIEEIRSMLRELTNEGVISHLDDRIRDDLSPMMSGIVFQVVNECLTNIRKHARARNVVVAMESSANGILVAVEDNGTGFDVARIDQDPAHHIGLELMRERAEAVGGWYRVESAPGRGTTTEFWIPSSRLNG